MYYLSYHAIRISSFDNKFDDKYEPILQAPCSQGWHKRYYR